MLGGVQDQGGEFRRMSQRNSDTVSSIEPWDDDPSDVMTTMMMGGDNGKKNLFALY
jgi:hypothetical protein